jgi:hypothetical protein
LHASIFRIGRRLFYHRAQQILDIMHPRREVRTGIDLVVIEAREAQEGRFGTNSQMMRIFILAILAFALWSCADFKGFHLKPAANDDYDNFGHVPGSGDPT